MDIILPVGLDNLWAVVVNEYGGGGRRLMWSPTHHSWLPSRTHGAGFSQVPDQEGRPYDDELLGATKLAEALRHQQLCQRCTLPELRDHFVAPDVFGMAALYCLQQPDPRVVASSAATESINTGDRASGAQP